MAPDGYEIIGGASTFCMWSEHNGFDLSHPSKPTSPPIYPRIPLTTKSSRVAVDPAKSALVVVDMQNYFLSPLLGRPSKSVGLGVIDKLLKLTIPACRKANIPIVWLGWGLTEQDVDEMPPNILRGFALDQNFDDKKPKSAGQLGEDMGRVELEDGTTIEARRVLMRDACNSDFYPSLADIVLPNDIWIHKTRLSGFWSGTGMEGALKSRGIRTLFFSGENTDQRVSHTLQDAYTKGWDCLMLSDGCGATSPEFATKCVEYNCDGGWGFVLT